MAPENDGVTSVAWAERGRLVSVGTHRGTVQIWDVTTCKRLTTMKGHSTRVGALAWNGDLLASGSRDGLILQRDIRTPATIAKRLSGHRDAVCGLKWSPDNQLLASGGNDNKLFVWGLHSLAPIQTFTEHLAAVKGIISLYSCLHIDDDLTNQFLISRRLVSSSSQSFGEWWRKG